jgi:hypothetical protein
VVHGKSFLGLPTLEGDALLVDQDSPKNTLIRRMHKFSSYFHCKPKHKLFYRVGEGLKLGDGSLRQVINQYKSIVLVWIDSLHSVTSGTNTNSTKEMALWADFKQKCLTSNKTIGVNHHITEHLEFSIDKLMTCDPHGLAMGNSTINQQLDSYYVMASGPPLNGRINKLYIRPIAKREAIPMRPSELDIIEEEKGDESSAYLSNLTPYRAELSECARDILKMFNIQQESLTVYQILEKQGGSYGIKEIRETLKELEISGKVKKSRQAHNLFRYFLSDNPENA